MRTLFGDRLEHENIREFVDVGGSVRRRVSLVACWEEGGGRCWCMRMLFENEGGSR